MQAIGENLRSAEDNPVQLPRRTKQSYSGYRKMRIISYTLTTLMSILLIYIITMKYVLHQPVPGLHRIRNFVRDFIRPGE